MWGYDTEIRHSPCLTVSKRHTSADYMKRNLKYNNRKNLVKDKCKICDTMENLENHRIEIGGPYTKENVACLCRQHHMLIHKLIRHNRLVSFDMIVCMARDIYESSEG